MNSWVITENKSRITDQVLDTIRRKIITLELPPGAMLDERAMAEELQCSRTPIREALQRLAEEQLVRNIPRRGTTVLEMSMSQLSDAFEIAVCLEALAARLAAQRATPQDLAQLDAVLDRAEAAEAKGDMGELALLDYDFHCGVDATHNTLLMAQLGRLTRLVTRFSYLGLKHAASGRQSLDEHRALLESLKAGDAAESEARILLEHLTKARERILAAL